MSVEIRLSIMDSFSITTDCIELGNTISRALLILNQFVREVREARSDLDEVSRELHSLQSVLDLLTEDAATLPSKLAAQTPALLEQCNRVAGELDATLLALDGGALSRTQKRAQWFSVGKCQIGELKKRLEAHRELAGLTLDLVGLTSSRDLRDLDEDENAEQLAEVQSEASRILEDIAQLRVRLPAEFEHDGSDFNLDTYSKALMIYANSLIGGSDAEEDARARHVQAVASSAGDPPDSAIEVSSESSFKVFADDRPVSPRTVPSAAPTAAPTAASQYILEVDELRNEMLEEDDAQSRPPTPPPKAIKRMESLRNKMVSPFDLPATNDFEEDCFGVLTTISAVPPTIDEESMISPTISRESKRSYPPASRSSRFFGKFLGVGNARSGSSDAASTIADDRPLTPVIQASLVRRGSKRLSMSITKKLPHWNSELEEPEGPSAPGSIFGVSLQKSMQTARSAARTHHNGSRGASRREFPLCIHKCVNFLLAEGIEAPNIFAEPGDGYRVQKLKEAFSSPPKYGDDINWEIYGVYDAADIILLFLTQLPKPLISEALAKRWISLSKQATLSGSLSQRTDQCIDFWEEALGGLRDPGRSVFKLLLNLWASIADAAEQNDMTAERLAEVILKPLMHTFASKYKTDFMLGLAFLIRRRSEYTMMLNEGRKSRAAWEA